MNRTSNSTNIKINYAQAAAQPKSKQHQNPPHQNQQQQQQKIQQTNSPSHSNNSASSVNGKSSQKSQPPNNSTLSNGNAGRSAPENKVAQQKNPVTLPAKARQWETNTSIQFGSINQPSANPPLSSSPVQPSLISGGKIPSSFSLPKNGTPTFGTVTARGPSEELVQPTPTQPAIAPTSSGSTTGAPKPLATRIQNEIPRTQSAPPLLNLQDPTNAKNVGQPSDHQMNTMISRTQQQLPAATPLQPVSTSNPPHHRKDSVSSTVSSNDGQQTQPYHPHQPQPHHNSYNQQHAHPQYHNHNHNRHIRPAQVPTQYHQRTRDKNVPGSMPPSSHSNPQSVPNQVQPSIPMTGPQTTIPMAMWSSYGRPYDPYYSGYAAYYMQPVIRPQLPVTSHLTQNVPPYTPTGQKSRAITIINPTDRSVVNVRPPVIPVPRKDEISVPGVVDAKRAEDADKEKEQVLDNDRKESKAVRIVNPSDKIEQERKEKEERDQREREEKERLEKEEKERKEREEKERKEREEKERKEREEKERKEREEKERKEREEKERKEREEREERERKEREERERKEREEKERKEREERERKEREEKERKEREEKERKEREEKEREERELKEREEKERKEREERERLEQEEKLKQEKLEREEAEQKEKEAERIAREERERVEQEEAQISEKKKKEAEEEEKKKEIELSDKKDVKKEEKKYGKGHRPEALDLSRTTSAPALGTGPLSSARKIDDLSSVQYPAHIKSPNPALNVGSDPGKFKYDRGFLMQFMEVCKDKPENLPALDAVGMEEAKDDKKGGPRGSRPMNQRTSPHLNKNMPGQSYPLMGEFKKSDSSYGPRTTSFGRSSSSLGPRSGSGSMLPPLISPPSPRGQNVPRRNEKHKKQTHGQNMLQELVLPLEVTENRWVPMMHNKEMDDHMEMVQRKVKALLNKLTLEKFDSISDQIIDFANKSRDEKDGHILKEVISLTFDKSCDEPNFSQMYAQLCRKMMERVDPEIIDENIKNSDNKYVQGGALFRKYLLNRCQENFEKGWKVNIPVPSNEKGEPDLMSDEYYTAARAKRHGLGLIRFIGELFKLHMLTERIMHECIKKLLTSPEEEEMESLCKLLTTVGQQLDHAKAKQHMDTYFTRMEDLSKQARMDEAKNIKLSSRIRFMIMDVIELRNNNWVPRRDNNAPKTIAEIHEDAAKQKEEAEFMRRTASSGGRGLPKMADQMSRGGSGRRGDKGSGPHNSGGQQADGGWSTVGGGSSSASRKTGDLSKFGSVRNKVSGSVNLTPGGGAFGGSKWKTDNKDRDDKTLMSRGNSASNMYSVLTHTDTETRKFSDGPLERKKLQLAPPSRTIPEKVIMTKPSSISIPMSEEIATKKIHSMIDEYFSVIDLGEVVNCINDLPKEYHAKSITEFANRALEKKQDDVYKVVNVFRKLVSEDVIPKSVFMEGFTPTMDFLIDISADAPKSYTFAGQLLYGSLTELKEVVKLLKPLYEVDDDKGIEKVMAGYLDEWKKSSGEQEIVQKMKDTGFDFKSSVFPKKSIDEINKFLDDHGLGSLKR